MPAKSKSQRRLLSYAYAYAKGDAPDAPESIKKVARSFMKRGKRKGLKALRDFAKTKESKLPQKVDEGVVITCSEFMSGIF